MAKTLAVKGHRSGRDWLAHINEVKQLNQDRTTEKQSAQRKLKKSEQSDQSSQDKKEVKPKTAKTASKMASQQKVRNLVGFANATTGELANAAN